MIHGQEKIQHVIAPGVSDEASEQRTEFYDHRHSKELKQQPAKLTVRSAKTVDGYLVEARMSWEAVAIEPKIGTQFRMQVMVNDADADTSRDPHNIKKTRTIYAWHQMPHTFSDNSMSRRVRLGSRYQLALRPDETDRNLARADTRRNPGHSH